MLTIDTSGSIQEGVDSGVDTSEEFRLTGSPAAHLQT